MEKNKLQAANNGHYGGMHSHFKSNKRYLKWVLLSELHGNEQWASSCSCDTRIKQTEWLCAIPLGPYDRTVTPSSLPEQARLLGSIIESWSGQHQVLYIRVMSARPVQVAELHQCFITGLLPTAATYRADS